jgi:hypothetical protein
MCCVRYVCAGLQAGVSYTYAVGNADGPKSAQWSFVAPPGRDASATLRFLAVADMGVVRGGVHCHVHNAHCSSHVARVFILLCRAPGGG